MALKYTDEQFIQAVKNSISIKDTLSAIKILGTGGNYKTFHRTVKRLNLDISHFKGKSHGKSKSTGSIAIPLEKILIENSTYSSSSDLRKRLVKENILQNQCSKCKIIDWNNEPLNLHLDHINGINNDNRLENLRILCPNCHSQTSTYCRGNVRNKLPKKEKVLCSFCNKNYRLHYSNSCKFCYIQPKKINWPPLKELEERLKKSNYTKLAKELGVSDNSIRKHIKIAKK